MKSERKAWPRMDAIPFDSKHRFMATLHESPAGEKVAFIKGAPEVVLEMCSREVSLEGERELDRND